MPLELGPETTVGRDREGRIIELDHSARPLAFPIADLGGPAAVRAVAEAYLREAAPNFDLAPSELEGLEMSPEGELGEGGSRLRFRRQREVAGLAVVQYVQTYSGLPVWDTAVGVRVSLRELAVVGASRQTFDGLQPRRPDLAAAPFAPEHMTPQRLGEALDLGDQGPLARINGASLMVYRFAPENREHDEIATPRDQPLSGGPPRIPLSPLDEDEFQPGSDWVVTCVLFTTSPPEGEEINWRAFLEPRTGAVLYIRALTASVQGSVFEIDPVTQGCPTCTGASSTSSLNLYRSERPLSGLTAPDPGDPQALEGEYVKIEDLDPPPIAPPTEPVGSDFIYDATTNDFSAVNAYYHCDTIYRMIADMGFDVATYFDGTTFPVPVDFRGKGGAVNASCNGNAHGDGTGKFLFGLVESGQPVGIATAFRVVWHEFGHALLWDHVDSPNFGFAHSAGDSLAAIFADPFSQALDKGLTFPFMTNSNPGLVRRQDRPVSTWAWFGVNYDRGYGGEQVLSTTLFRAYQSSGGGSDVLSYKLFASQYMLYLIVSSCGLMTHTTSDPTVYVNALTQADKSTAQFHGEAGGTLYKIIRWSFAQQGLYQAPGTLQPYTAPGQPPANDLYVDDGRGGQYTWIANWKDTQDIWNRRAPDGGTSNQAPAPGTSNYLYVRVKNRGTDSASNAEVRTFQIRQSSQGDWPGDWTPTQTASLAASGDIPSGGEQVLGPFTWVPGGFSGESVLAIVANPDDPAIVDNPQIAGGTIPNWRLVPSDNNIAQRTF